MDNWVAAGSGRDRQWYRSRPLYEQAAVGAGVGAVGAKGKGHQHSEKRRRPACPPIRATKAVIHPAEPCSINLCGTYIRVRRAGAASSAVQPAVQTAAQDGTAVQPADETVVQDAADTPVHDDDDEFWWNRGGPR